MLDDCWDSLTGYVASCEGSCWFP